MKGDKARIMGAGCDAYLAKPVLLLGISEHTCTATSVVRIR
jgi:hypothetical protein